jgi:hypothetical protein
MKSLGWKEGDLERQRKGIPEKTQIAQRLRRETPRTLAWIAAGLRMGTRTHLPHLLYRQGKEKNRSRHAN